MKSYRITNPMRVGSIITKEAPHTLVRVIDNSATAIPGVPANGFNITQVLYLPKGPTNTWMYFNGDTALSNFTTMCGTPNTVLYGKMATYAARALEGGFGLNVLNVAPPDATHANFYISYVIEKMLGEDGVTELTDSIFCYKDAADFYWFAKTIEELNVPAGEEASVVTISYPKLRVGFDTRYIDGVDLQYDPIKFLEEEEIKLNVPTDGDISKFDVNIPVIGMFYEGATDYGNNYTFNVTRAGIDINGLYPYYTANIKDLSKSEYEFNFTLFNAQYNNVTTNFENVAFKTCRTATAENRDVPTFRSHLASRKISNKMKSITNTLVTSVTTYVLAKVKEAMPEFNEVSSTSNLNVFLESTTNYANLFKTSDSEYGRTVETPFTYVTPWTDINSNDLLFEHKISPSTIPFTGGYSGKLKTILEEEEFSWDIKYNPEDPDEKPIFVEMFKNAYSGVTDDAIFDPALVKHSLMVGDGYPNEIQDIMEKLCRNDENFVYETKTRLDFSYWRTPPETVTDFDEVLDWLEAINLQNREFYNTNCKLFVGRAMFNDSTTGGQTEFELIYDLLGTDSPLSNWLTSGTTDSFASGSYSDIIGAIKGTEILLPNADQAEVLSKKDTNYWGYKEDLTLALSEDTAMFEGFLSILKNTGSSIPFNAILSECMLIARDKKIITPTEENIDRVRRAMLTRVTLLARHFGGTLTIEPEISTDPLEEGRNVVVYNIGVKKGLGSRHNRVVMSANLE